MKLSKTHVFQAEAIRVTIAINGIELPGDLIIPENCHTLVVFAHGSGSSRFSPRNLAVAESLNKAGLGTLLFDLLTSREHMIDEQECTYRFDVEMLGERLTKTMDWLLTRSDTVGLDIGLFGASTGAAASFIAAAERPERIKAIVSRGGRPDLAKPYLARVRAPSLFIIGGEDTPVIAMNRSAMADIHSEKRLEIIPGAGHLFEEPGKLEEVAALARDWFVSRIR